MSTPADAPRSPGSRRSGADADPVRSVQALFLQHAARLRGFIRGLQPDVEAADDVFQEVFLVVTRKADRFEPGTSFLSWVRTIARHEVQAQRRSRRSGPPALDPRVAEALARTAEAMDDEWEPHGPISETPI